MSTTGGGLTIPDDFRQGCAVKCWRSAKGVWARGRVQSVAEGMCIVRLDGGNGDHPFHWTDLERA
jgi:hypothetical protein